MKTNPLDHISVASPCPADWDQMYGDNRKRFCSECRLNVYNLSEMTREEAENFLFAAEGRVCVRLYRRRDGTVITQDCPVGWQAVKQRVSRVATAVFGLIAGFFGGLWATNQISNIYRPSVEKIAAETSDEAGYAVPDQKENRIILQDEQLIDREPLVYVGRVNAITPPKNKEAIDFNVNGRVGNMDEIQKLFTERYPK